MEGVSPADVGERQTAANPLRGLLRVTGAWALSAQRERSQDLPVGSEPSSWQLELQHFGGAVQTGVWVSDESCGGALSVVSPVMKPVVDAVWAVWSIGASVYDYVNTKAMEERIHALENVITIHQCLIGALSVGLVILITYILLRKQ
ncbi:hypothetical protein COCON_G00025350 [Conger conger]|uniref:Uncharacterized protein n=1 Tax=Conger conger TaxID=82655 RepID=A0A9Q1DXQ8_CONCO|nr:hypothetical protein COCON_G00025350 [Conger conger]